MENNKMSPEELANMLVAALKTNMTITMEDDRVEITGGTGMGIVDMYIIEKALEAKSKEILPIFESADALKSALKESIDLFDFGDNEEIEDDSCRS